MPSAVLKGAFWAGGSRGGRVERLRGIWEKFGFISLGVG